MGLFYIAFIHVMDEGYNNVYHLFGKGCVCVCVLEVLCGTASSLASSSRNIVYVLILFCECGRTYETFIKIKYKYS